MQKVPISVVVITKNEKEHIAACLESVSWAAEIVVVDDNSTDNTVAIAKIYTDKVFSRGMDVEGRHRNYAYSLAANKWVLSLDADERASAGLEEELREILKHPIEHVVFAIPMKTYIGNKWIQYGGWYPASKARLFNKDIVKYEETGVHPRILYHGSCGQLKNDIIHYSYKDFHEYFSSLNNQTTLEAKKWFDEKRKMNFLKMYRKGLSRFLRYYIAEQGFRDGFIGFALAQGRALYQYMSYVKYMEMLSNVKEGKAG